MEAEVEEEEKRKKKKTFFFLQIWTIYGQHGRCIDTISKSVDILSIWSPYCPYHVPKSRYIFKNIDFEMSIQRPCCPYMVHIKKKKISFSFLLLLLLLPYWIFFRPLYKANIFLAFLFLNFYISHMPVFASISISNF